MSKHSVFVGLALLAACGHVYESTGDQYAQRQEAAYYDSHDPCGGEPECQTACEKAEQSGDEHEKELCDELVTEASLRETEQPHRIRPQKREGTDALKAPNPSTRALSPEQIFSASVRSLVAIEHGDSLGSGFVLSSEGLVVTNVHVLAGAKKAKVTLMNGTELPITHVLAFDDRRDVMIFAVGKHARAVPLAGHNKIVMAQQVFALGNPKGLMATISEGLVSGVRKFDDDYLVLQVTAPISPGSSGGPLFDKYGNVIGVATAGIAGGGRHRFRRARALRQRPARRAQEAVVG